LDDSRVFPARSVYFCRNTRMTCLPFCGDERDRVRVNLGRLLPPCLWSLADDVQFQILRDRIEGGHRQPAFAGHEPAERCVIESGGFANLVARLAASRSEEHTSELQSRFDLVCRL